MFGFLGSNYVTIILIQAKLVSHTGVKFNQKDVCVCAFTGHSLKSIMTKLGTQNDIYPGKVLGHTSF